MILDIIIDIIELMCTCLLVIFALITLKQTSNLNKKNQFFQVYCDILRDKEFRHMCHVIEQKYNFEDDNSALLDYFLKMLQNLLSINETLTLQYFKRELFILIFVDDFYCYIKDLCIVGCDDIYSKLFKSLEKLKLVFFDENIKIYKKDESTFMKIYSYKYSNYYEALKTMKKNFKNGKTNNLTRYYSCINLLI